jgi:hypothetical protein
MVFRDKEKTGIDIDEFVKAVRIAFPKYKFELTRQGVAWDGGRWCRIFVSHNGVQIGRVNFRPFNFGIDGELYCLYGAHHYKPRDYEYEPMDDFFYQFDFWYETGIVLDIVPLVVEAKKLTNEKIERILEYRKANPTKPNRRRKKITSSFTSTLRNLVRPPLPTN